jgi:hypothetical protein
MPCLCEGEGAAGGDRVVQSVAFHYMNGFTIVACYPRAAVHFLHGLSSKLPEELDFHPLS